MSRWLLIIVTLIYVGVAISFWREGRKAMAVVFFAYAVANVGLIAEGWLGR